MKYHLICTIMLVILSASSILFAGPTSSSSSSSSDTKWSGLKSLNQMSKEDRTLLREMDLLSVRDGAADGAHSGYGQAVEELGVSRFVMPNNRDLIRHLAEDARLHYAAGFGGARTAVLDTYLSSKNYGPISITRTLGESGSGGGTAGSSSSSYSHSSVVTTCDENLKYLGFQISCRTGSGSGVFLGTTYEFINWKPVMAQGIAKDGVLKWELRNNTITIEHLMKKTSVTFHFGDDDIKVISAENLMSFKRDLASGNLLDTVSHNMTRSYVDLAWRKFVYIWATQGGVGETKQGDVLWSRNWMHLGFAANCMEEFVYTFATYPELASKKLMEAADYDEEFAKRVRNGEITLDHRRLVTLPNGTVRPFTVHDLVSKTRKNEVKR